MNKIITVLLALYGFSFAGGFSYNQFDSYGNTVVSTVEIRDKGIYNLIVSSEIASRDDGKKIVYSEEYGLLIQKIRTASKAIILSVIQDNPEITVADFKRLRTRMETDVTTMIAAEIKACGFKKPVDIPFAIVSMYVLEPSDR